MPEPDADGNTLVDTVLGAQLRSAGALVGGADLPVTVTSEDGTQDAGAGPVTTLPELQFGFGWGTRRSTTRTGAKPELL